MPLNDKARLIPNGHKLICGEADSDIDDVMALRAGQMVVVFASTADTIVMRPIFKSSGRAVLYSPTFRPHGRPWLGLSVARPVVIPAKILNREICAEAKSIKRSAMSLRGRVLR